MPHSTTEKNARWADMVQKAKVRKISHNRAAAELVNRGPATQTHRPVAAPSGPSAADRAATAAVLAKTREDGLKLRVVRAAAAMFSLRPDRFGSTVEEQFAAVEGKLFQHGLHCAPMRSVEELSAAIWRTDLSKIGNRFGNQKTLNALLKNEN